MARSLATVGRHGSWFMAQAHATRLMGERLLLLVLQF
jgi:hypothetical protein